MSPERNGRPSEGRTRGADKRPAAARRSERPRPPEDAVTGEADDRPETTADVVRPLAVSGIVAAIWCAGLGLTTLTTITLIGWIAAPRTALGTGLPGVFRTAVNFWLVSHHAGFSVPHGRVGLLPLGLTVLPGALLFRGGGWITRTGRVRGRYRIGVVHAALALAVPYAVLAGLLALAPRSALGAPAARPAALAGLPLAPRAR